MALVHPNGRFIRADVPWHGSHPETSRRVPPAYPERFRAASVVCCQRMIREAARDNRREWLFFDATVRLELPDAGGVAVSVSTLESRVHRVALAPDGTVVIDGDDRYTGPAFDVLAGVWEWMEALGEAFRLTPGR